MLTLAGIIDFPTADWDEGIATAGAAGNALQQVTGLNIPFVTTGPDSTAGRTLYGQLVVRNAYVPVSGEIFTVSLIVSQD
jgi:hypothetical protein